ncbi:MAG: hypothetical protein JWO05_2760 [Gemmatimonadetes bacterium]|nr:hypothetical protein [Gemmatimonadota bacterium]
MTRRTISAGRSVSGIGLHLGAPVTLTFRPASSGAGISFRRTDRAGDPAIPALASHCELSEFRTQLGSGDSAVHTVEHVLAAVGALEIDDLIIELDAAEPPIMDGSAAPFFEALQGAGLREQTGTPTMIVVRRPVRFTDGSSTYAAFPACALDLEVGIDFPHPLIGRQRSRYVVSEATFASELSQARTFGFVEWVEGLRAKGLIRGASTDNCVVLDGGGVVDNALRWPDEFVRHKAMDCVGDLVLAGGRVRARIVADRPSHRGTVQFVRAILDSLNTEKAMLGVDEIMRVLPHRYPFLLVDRILELEPGKRVVGMKNVTINEPFFQGHFPGHPIMPGVLVIEAMAQVGGMLLLGDVEKPEEKVVYFTSLDGVRWRRPVKPGDQLRFELTMLAQRGMLCKMKGIATVDGEVVCEAEMGAMVRDR